MKKCPVCGAKNADDATVCKKCDADLSIYDLNHEEDNTPFISLPRGFNIFLQVLLMLFFVAAISCLVLDLAEITSITGKENFIIHTKYIFYDQWKILIEKKATEGSGMPTIIYFAKVCISNLTIGIATIGILIFSIVGFIGSIRVLRGTKEGCNAKNFIKVAVSWITILLAVYLCYYSETKIGDKIFGLKPALGAYIVIGSVLLVALVMGIGRIIGKNKKGDRLYNFFGFFAMLTLVASFVLIFYMVPSIKLDKTVTHIGLFALFEDIIMKMINSGKVNIELLIGAIITISFYTYMTSALLQVFKGAFNFDDNNSSYKGPAINALISTVLYTIASIYVTSTYTKLYGTFDFRFAYILGIGLVTATCILFVFSNKEEKRKKDFIELD